MGLRMHAVCAGQSAATGRELPDDLAPHRRDASNHENNRADDYCNSPSEATIYERAAGNHAAALNEQ